MSLGYWFILSFFFFACTPVFADFFSVDNCGCGAFGTCEDNACVCAAMWEGEECENSRCVCVRASELIFCERELISRLFPFLSISSLLRVSDVSIFFLFFVSTGTGVHCEVSWRYSKPSFHSWWVAHQALELVLTFGVLFVIFYQLYVTLRYERKL